MAHGTPDWGQTAGVTTVFQLEDLAELAVRLGSIVTFHRSGDVLYLDDFEHGIAHWTDTPSGAGAAVDVGMARARSGLFSYRLAGGSDGGRSAQIQRRLPFGIASNFGFEYSFSLQNLPQSFTMALDVFDGSQLTQFTLSWTAATQLLSYLDANNVNQPIAVVPFSAHDASHFATLKLVGDQVDTEYVRVILNSTLHSLDNIAARRTADATRAQIRLRISLISDAGQNDTMFVDDVIVTQNEPA